MVLNTKIPKDLQEAIHKGLDKPEKGSKKKKHVGYYLTQLRLRPELMEEIDTVIKENYPYHLARHTWFMQVIQKALHEEKELIRQRND